MVSEERRKICDLSSVHQRYDFWIFLEECNSLNRNGYEVNLHPAEGNGNEEKDGVNIYDLGLPKKRFKRISFYLGNLIKKAILFDVAIYHSQTGKYGLQKKHFSLPNHIVPSEKKRDGLS